MPTWPLPARRIGTRGCSCSRRRRREADLNALDDYRRLQRALRREFDLLTVDLCPECEEPCCREPSRVGPVDLLLAEAVGWQSQAVQPLPDGLDEKGNPTRVGAPCRHLAVGGCTMPADLRPYGCTAYVCRPMLRSLDRVRGARVRRLVRQMGEAHEAVLARVRRQQRGEPGLF